MRQITKKERSWVAKSHEVQAILAGQQSMFWRPVPTDLRPMPDDTFMRGFPEAPRNVRMCGWYAKCDAPAGSGHVSYRVRCPYGAAGERVWVREAWCRAVDQDTLQNNGGFWYRADGVHVVRTDGDGFTQYTKAGWEASPWSSAACMPREASRLTLEIEVAYVMLVQDFTRDDALRGGALFRSCVCSADGERKCGRGMLCEAGRSDLDWLCWRWNTDFGRTHPWASNPWAWVVKFRKAEAAP